MVKEGTVLKNVHTMPTDWTLSLLFTFLAFPEGACEIIRVSTGKANFGAIEDRILHIVVVTSRKELRVQSAKIGNYYGQRKAEDITVGETYQFNIIRKYEGSTINWNNWTFTVKLNGSNIHDEVESDILQFNDAKVFASSHLLKSCDVEIKKITFQESSPGNHELFIFFLIFSFIRMVYECFIMNILNNLVKIILRYCKV